MSDQLATARRRRVDDGTAVAANSAYLGGECVLVAAERVAVGTEGLVAGAQRGEVAL